MAKPDGRMGERHDLWAVANLLVGRYGDEAGRRANRNARDAERDGDRDSGAIWTDVGSLLTQGACGDRREQNGANRR